MVNPKLLEVVDLADSSLNLPISVFILKACVCHGDIILNYFYSPMFLPRNIF